MFGGRAGRPGRRGRGGRGGAQRGSGGGTLLRELAWRDYFLRVYEVVGDGVWENLEPLKTGWGRGDYAEELPGELERGETGLACMDAFARELRETGYLHNHARMWLAAYAVHFRRVKWQAGARWFLHHLLDGDEASNNLSWQWVASTFSGKPYFFNRENLERYTGGVYCGGCPQRGRCPMEGSYEELERRLFARRRVGEGGGAGDETAVKIRLARDRPAGPVGGAGGSGPVASEGTTEIEGEIEGESQGERQGTVGDGIVGDRTIADGTFRKGTVGGATVREATAREAAEREAIGGEALAGEWSATGSSGLVLAHDRALSAEHPVYRGARRVVFVWEPEVVEGWSLGRGVFVAESVAELFETLAGRGVACEVRVGSVVEEVVGLLGRGAGEADGRVMRVATSPDPRLGRAVARLRELGVRVEVVKEPAFALLDRDADGARFFRYWKRVERQVVGGPGGDAPAGGMAQGAGE